MAELVKGSVADAEVDFRRALDFSVFDDETLLWLHWARARQGKDDKAELAAAARRFDLKKWPGPAIRFALGQLSVEAMLAAAKDPSAMITRQQEAQAYFFAGEYYLAVRRPLDAQNMFRSVIARNLPYNYSDAAAGAELAALK